MKVKSFVVFSFLFVCLSSPFASAQVGMRAITNLADIAVRNTWTIYVAYADDYLCISMDGRTCSFEVSHGEHNFSHAFFDGGDAINLRFFLDNLGCLGWGTHIRISKNGKQQQSFKPSHWIGACGHVWSGSHNIASLREKYYVLYPLDTNTGAAQNSCLDNFRSGRVGLWPYHGGDNQIWFFAAGRHEDHYKLCSKEDQRCLRLIGPVGNSGVTMEGGACTHDHCLWRFTDSGHLAPNGVYGSCVKASNWSTLEIVDDGNCTRWQIMELM